MICYIDRFCLFSLPLQINEPPLKIDQETGLKFITRFKKSREEWNNAGGETGVDAIKFLSDCDLILGKFYMFIYRMYHNEIRSRAKNNQLIFTKSKTCYI